MPDHETKNDKMNLLMNSTETRGEGDALAQLEEAIRRSPESVKSEFDRTPNDWLRCFGSRIFVIETYLNGPGLKAQMAPGDYAVAAGRMEKLKERLKTLEEQYIGKVNMPPDALQRELFEELDILQDLL